MTNFCNPLVLLELQDLPPSELNLALIRQISKSWLDTHKKQAHQVILYQGLPISFRAASAAIKLLENPDNLALMHRLSKERDLSDFLHGRTELSFGNISQNSIWNNPHLTTPLRQILQPALSASLAHALRNLNRKRVLEITTLVETTPVLDPTACYQEALHYIDTQTQILAATELDPADPDYARRTRAIRKDFNNGLVYEARNFNTLPGHFFRTALTPMALAISKLARLSFQAEPAFAVKMFSTARLLELDHAVHQQIEAAYALTAGTWEPPMEEKDPEPPLPPPPPPKRKPPPPKAKPFTPPPPPPPQHNQSFWTQATTFFWGKGRVWWVLVLIALNVVGRGKFCSNEHDIATAPDNQTFSITEKAIPYYEPIRKPNTVPGAIEPSSNLKNIWPLLHTPLDTSRIKKALTSDKYSDYEKGILRQYLESARKPEREDLADNSKKPLLPDELKVISPLDERKEAFKDIYSRQSLYFLINPFQRVIRTSKNYGQCSNVTIKGDSEWDAVVFLMHGNTVNESFYLFRKESKEICLSEGENRMLVVFGRSWSKAKTSPCGTEGFFDYIGQSYQIKSDDAFNVLKKKGSLQLSELGKQPQAKCSEVYVFGVVTPRISRF